MHRTHPKVLWPGCLTSIGCLISLRTEIKQAHTVPVAGSHNIAPVPVHISLESVESTTPLHGFRVTPSDKPSVWAPAAWSSLEVCVGEDAGAKSRLGGFRVLWMPAEPEKSRISLQKATALPTSRPGCLPVPDVFSEWCVCAHTRLLAGTRGSECVAPYRAPFPPAAPALAGSPR